MSNKRGYDRIEVDGIAQLNIDGHVYHGWLKNICFGGFAGFCAIVGKPIESGSTLDFKISITSIGEEIEGKGFVKHIKELERGQEKIMLIGIEFTEVNVDLVEYILKKLHAYNAQLKGGKGSCGPIDFIPY